MIRQARPDDATQLADIYNHYVLNTVITFEEAPVLPVEMAARIQSIEAHGLPWLVAEDNGMVQGFAYANTWKARHAYRHSVEITIYLAPNLTTRGIGTNLYHALFKALRQLQVHAVVACIALPNAHSAALHEKFGMKKTGHFSEVGYKFGRWLDVGYWQVNLKLDK